MKKALTILAILGLAGSAYAGCGKKVDVNGSLTKLDLESKKIEVDGKAYTLVPSALIPISWVTAEGVKAPADAKVVITHEHNKVEVVKEAKG